MITAVAAWPPAWRSRRTAHASSVRLAVAASLKAVPLLFVLAYIARRQWHRASLAVGLTLVLVAPMPVLGCELRSTDPGASLSLYYLVAPTVWAAVAAIAVIVSVVVASFGLRCTMPAAGTAAILTLPRLLLYDVTDMLVGADRSESFSASATLVDRRGLAGTVSARQNVD